MRSKFTFLLGGLLLSSLAAHAATYTFDFNTLKDPSFYGGVSGANTAVQTYMNGLLSGGASVAVAGAVTDMGKPSASSGEDSYIGEGFVVGPTSAASLTLGNSEGVSVDGSPNVIKTSGGSVVYDTFIRNNGFSSAAGADRITMTFSGLKVYSVSFDYEIFPDGTCPSLTNCGGTGSPNLPDFELFGDGAMVIQKFGVVPGSAGTYSASPNHSAGETAPQALGTATWTFSTPVTKIEFVDWPAMIGIDNLVITSAVPEPSSVVLLASFCLACGLLIRKKLTACG